MSTPQDSMIDTESLGKTVIDEFPYPVAVHYRRMLEETNWQSKTIMALRVFEYAVRVVTLGLASQYLCCDTEEVSDSRVNEIFRKKILSGKPTLGPWVELLFALLEAYKGQKARLFMPQLYDLLWDPNAPPDTQRQETRRNCERLISIRNDVVHGAPPKDEYRVARAQPRCSESTSRCAEELLVPHRL